MQLIIIISGQALIELSKEKSSLKQAESQTHQFLKTLGHVESKLTEQINYLTQVSTGKKNCIIRIGRILVTHWEFNQDLDQHITKNGSCCR
jgi:F0F1-type ATP synthase delta subunit